MKIQSYSFKNVIKIEASKIEGFNNYTTTL